MALVVDASVAFKWFVPEANSGPALALLDQADEFVAPDLIVLEVINAMWARLRGQNDFESIVTEACVALPKMLDSMYPLTDLMPRSLELGIELNHRLYDCVYLALAERQKLQLVTADLNFSRKVRDSSYSQYISSLTEEFE